MNEIRRRDMRIKLFEEFTSRTISVDIRGGSAMGVIHTNRTNFENWLLSERVDDEARGFFAMFPDSRLLPVAIFKNMNVDEGLRGRGIGSKLMSEFLNQASDAKNVVLIADTGESNAFDLEKWYGEWGFTRVGTAGNDPVMVLNNY